MITLTLLSVAPQGPGGRRGRATVWVPEGHLTLVPFLLAHRDAMLRYLVPRMPGRRSSRAGYSFAELVITVGLIAIVTTWAMPSFLNYLRSARVRAGAQTVSAYLNEGRQLAIKSNGSVCVRHTTSTIHFRTTNCTGTVINVAGLADASGDVRLPDNVSLSLLSGSSAIFGQLGNATTAGTYRVTDVPSARTLNVIVAPSGRICISSTTSCS
jgi:Tfp pilus assembly protein FimT